MFGVWIVLEAKKFIGASVFASCDANKKMRLSMSKSIILLKYFTSYYSPDRIKSYPRTCYWNGFTYYYWASQTLSVLLQIISGQKYGLIYKIDHIRTADTLALCFIRQSFISNLRSVGLLLMIVFIVNGCYLNSILITAFLPVIKKIIKLFESLEKL